MKLWFVFSFLNLIGAFDSAQKLCSTEDLAEIRQVVENVTGQGWREEQPENLCSYYDHPQFIHALLPGEDNYLENWEEIKKHLDWLLFAHHFVICSNFISSCTTNDLTWTITGFGFCEVRSRHSFDLPQAFVLKLRKSGADENFRWQIISQIHYGDLTDMFDSETKVRLLDQLGVSASEKDTLTGNILKTAAILQDLETDPIVLSKQNLTKLGIWRQECLHKQGQINLHGNRFRFVSPWISTANANLACDLWRRLHLVHDVNIQEETLLSAVSRGSESSTIVLKYQLADTQACEIDLLAHIITSNDLYAELHFGNLEKLRRCQLAQRYRTCES